jgi:hypothetical protein
MTTTSLSSTFSLSNSGVDTLKENSVLYRNVLRIPKLREWRFPNFEVVRSNQVSLNLFALVWGIEVAPLSVGEERVFTEGLLMVVEPGRDVALHN